MCVYSHILMCVHEHNSYYMHILLCMCILCVYVPPDLEVSIVMYSTCIVSHAVHMYMLMCVFAVCNFVTFVGIVLWRGESC